MSNSRIFCWGFVTATVVFMFFGLSGAGSQYAGMSALVGKFMLSVHTGVVAVAMFGDRAKDRGP